jgi:hypothetical protein
VFGEQIPIEREVKMLGRHVYRVHQEEEHWTVIKEGDGAAPVEYGGRDEAVKEACRRAETDQPSRVIVDNGEGAILEEHLFGSDLSQELDSTPR